VKLGSLCSGIGGFELGLEWALGCETAWQVEMEPHCRAVLAHHWPNAKRFDDVFKVGAHNLEPVDIVCFGSPCQDLSSAGKRLGLSGPKSRLFYECARVVGELRPEWVAFENVASGASRWVDAVRQELEERGYATFPFQIGAGDCGAPHRRDRVFIVAHAERVELRQQSGGGRLAEPERSATVSNRSPLPTLTTNRASYQRRRGVVYPTLIGVANMKAAVPTLCARDEKGPGPAHTRAGSDLPQAAGGHLSPTFCEWFMGFPLGWTEPVIGSPRSETRARRRKPKLSATSSESSSKPSNGEQSDA
jgi:DNA (cytosine-5)-methyltransferase 1